jgi:hypothetical protein
MGCDCKKKVVQDENVKQMQINIENSKKDLESIIERLSEKIYKLEKELRSTESDKKEYLSFKDVK